MAYKVQTLFNVYVMKFCGFLVFMNPNYMVNQISIIFLLHNITPDSPPVRILIYKTFSSLSEAWRLSVVPQTSSDWWTVTSWPAHTSAPPRHRPYRQTTDRDWSKLCRRSVLRNDWPPTQSNQCWRSVRMWKKTNKNNR